jgi:Family of unknown function (DUF5677)
VGLEPRDINEMFLFLAYARAYRCFQAIRVLCGDPQSDGEDPLILTRALLSLALRSLWPVSTGDPKEREERAQRRTWYTMTEEVKRLRALNDPTDAEHLERVKQDVAEVEAWFASRSLKPSELSEADIAKRMDLDVYYDMIYRFGSATTHHSQLAALGSFVHEAKGDEPFAPITLRHPKPEQVDQVFMWAVVVHATFLENAEPSIRLGVGEEAAELVKPWLEEQHRIATGKKE